MLTVALCKGKLLEPSLALLERAGVRLPVGIAEGRRLVFVTEHGAYKFIIVRPFDVPTYVEYGAAELGIVGEDVLRETKRDVYEPLDLRLGRCRMVVAAPTGKESLDVGLHSSYKVATRYPNIVREHFLNKGVHVEIVPLYGSVELAPATGLSDLIVDVMDTGATLRENGLVCVEEILTSTGRLIVNRAAYRMRRAEVDAFVRTIKQCLSDEENGKWR